MQSGPDSRVTAEADIPYGCNADNTFPSYTGNRHLLTFGPTRSGKGATVIVQALLRVPHSVICIDSKRTECGHHGTPSPLGRRRVLPQPLWHA